MFLFNVFLRLLGVFFILAMIFINTNKGDDFLVANGIPIRNSNIRELTNWDLDTELNQNEQYNDERPIFRVFDLPSFIFIVFLLIGYILVSFELSALAFIFKKALTATSTEAKTLQNLTSNLKKMSDAYYTSGGGALKGIIGRRKIPKIWNVIIERIEMRIPFEDIMMILSHQAALTRKNYESTIKIVSSLSNICPSFGVMGTVLGLMKVLRDLSDPTTLGPNISLALITTFYGLILSVIVFKPILTHIENMKVIDMNGYQAASFWLSNLANNNPSFYLEQTRQLR